MSSQKVRRGSPAMTRTGFIGPSASRSSSAVTCFKSTYRTASARPSVNWRAAGRRTIRFSASTSRGNSGDDPIVATRDAGRVRSGAAERRRMRWWRRHFAESITGSGTGPITATEPDALSHAFPHAVPDAGADTESDAKRGHHHHYYVRRRLTENADGAGWFARDIREQRHARARDGLGS